jgi:hypothetical protein
MVPLWYHMHQLVRSKTAVSLSDAGRRLPTPVVRVWTVEVQLTGIVSGPPLHSASALLTGLQKSLGGSNNEKFLRVSIR